jgi:hypothetical protein
VNQRKPPSGPPKVEVIRRPAATPGTPAAPPAPRPVPVAVTPRPVGPPTPRPAPTGGAPRPSGPQRAGPPQRRFGPRTPRPPPTPEQINTLARKERVPARIAKGDLEGKMRTHIWRKLHAEEAKRFSLAYELMDKMPSLDLADAFGIIQSGRPPEEFLARKARGQVKTAIKEARGTVAREGIDAFVKSLVDSKAEVALVLSERTLFDAVASEGPVAFTLDRTGRLEKLQLVLLTRRTTWERMAGGLERDPKLAKKPQGVPREPEKRPVADPRPFLPHVGQPVRLELRNGMALQLTLLGVGPFDVLVGDPGEELFVPLHALLKWSTELKPSSPSAGATKSESPD